MLSVKLCVLFFGGRLLGLFFGLLCTPVQLCIGGWAYAVSWWISGIPFDLAHCAGNFAMALLLYRPCRRVLEELDA